MTKAEERAQEAFPLPGLIHERCVFRWGYEQSVADILTAIESRLSEIIGDAQPKPALRAELEELIKRIKDGK